ncbi:YwaF family protein [Salipaludibacillus sp. CF4.18]|uniref:YwaF family protein n=1 Tax=Salipaludibacillus sp. CF4.18 TaxID=3373081 RepID=UPI003EE600DF
MWFGGDASRIPFTMFSENHWIVISIFLFVLVAMYLLRNKLSTRDNRRFEIGLALSLLFFEIAFQLWIIITGKWDVSFALPLDLSSISVMLVIILLLTSRHSVFEVVFLVGIAGALQAVFTPVLSFDFPHFRFFHFFYSHILVIWVVFYYRWYKGFNITLVSIVKAIVFLNVLFPFIYALNVIVDGNYWFLMRKPTGGSLLDFLGPHPWYIIGMEITAILFFFVLWLVFADKGKSMKHE